MVHELRPISRRLWLGAAIGGGEAALFFLAITVIDGVEGSGFFSASAMLGLWALFAVPVVAGAALVGAFAGGALLEKMAGSKWRWAAVALIAAAAGWLLSRKPFWIDLL